MFYLFRTCISNIQYYCIMQQVAGQVDRDIKGRFRIIHYRDRYFKEVELHIDGNREYFVSVISEANASELAALYSIEIIEQ
jgi:hypothetical protein